MIAWTPMLAAVMPAPAERAAIFKAAGERAVIFENEGKSCRPGR
ncbi:hypothetical protein [Sphingomonas changbaiensis]|nr:hypothetical protein [Sphingomonas changbaiensis]